MNHEQYASSVYAIPLERYRAHTKLHHECPQGHRILATPEAMLDGKMCAHCEGFELDEVLPAIAATGMKLTGRIGSRVMLEEGGRRFMSTIEDVVNGLRPGEQPKLPGTYLYYARVGDLYKVSTSRNPYKTGERILRIQFFDREITAQRAVEAVKRRFNPVNSKGRKGSNDLYRENLLE